MMFCRGQGLEKTLLRVTFSSIVVQRLILRESLHGSESGGFGGGAAPSFANQMIKYQDKCALAVNLCKGCYRNVALALRIKVLHMT